VLQCEGGSRKDLGIAIEKFVNRQHRRR